MSSWPGLSRPSTSWARRSKNVDARNKYGHDGGSGMLDNPQHPTIDEFSLRYEGWRIVAVCFLLATFGWGLGFYGQSVYVAELQRAHGWAASLISSATTVFYLFGALLVLFGGGAVHKYGPGLGWTAGTPARRPAAVATGAGREPWQLYLANAVLAFG